MSRHRTRRLDGRSPEPAPEFYREGQATAHHKQPQKLGASPTLNGGLTGRPTLAGQKEVLTAPYLEFRTTIRYIVRHTGVCRGFRTGQSIPQTINIIP